MTTDFKDETIKAIKGRTIDSFKLLLNTTMDKENTLVFSGKDNIDWELFSKKIVEHYEDNEIDYDKGNPFRFNIYSQFFGGWITFKDTSDFIEMRDEDDDGAYWHQVVKPTL